MPLRLVALLTVVAALAVSPWRPRAAVAVAAAVLLISAAVGVWPIGLLAAGIGVTVIAARADRAAGRAGAAMLAVFLVVVAVCGAAVDVTEVDFRVEIGAGHALVYAVVVGILVPPALLRRPVPRAPWDPQLPLRGRLPVISPVEVTGVLAVTAYACFARSDLYASPPITATVDDSVFDTVGATVWALTLALYSLALVCCAFTPWYPVRGTVGVLALYLVLGIVAVATDTVTPARSVPVVAVAVYVATRAATRSAGRLSTTLRGPIGLALLAAAVLAVVPVLGTGASLVNSVDRRGIDLLGEASGAYWRVFAATTFNSFVFTAVLPFAAVVAGLLVSSWRAAQDQQAQAARRVAELEVGEVVGAERARMARDLHDVVAHHISLVTVRAEAAPFTVPDLSPAARDAFADIASRSRQALDELRGVLRVLRPDGDGPDLAPRPTLADIAGLVAQARDAGAVVDFAGLPAELLDADGAVDPARVPDATSLAAYRIVREALSNARRHAPGAPVTLTVTAADALDVRVTNPSVAAAPQPGPVPTGLGLVGMRERAAGVGGTLDAGLRDGVFVVEARLPLRTAP